MSSGSFSPSQKKKFYGILAAVDAPDDVRERVLREGIYFARIHDEEFELCVLEDLSPHAFWSMLAGLAPWHAPAGPQDWLGVDCRGGRSGIPGLLPAHPARARTAQARVAALVEAGTVAASGSNASSGGA